MIELNYLYELIYRLKAGQPPHQEITFSRIPLSLQYRRFPRVVLEKIKIKLLDAMKLAFYSGTLRRVEQVVRPARKKHGNS
jgi:hypothetical protein